MPNIASAKAFDGRLAGPALPNDIEELRVIALANELERLLTIRRMRGKKNHNPNKKFTAGYMAG